MAKFSCVRFANITADLACLNVSLGDSDVSNIIPNHAVKITCAVVPDLYDKFILTASVIDRFFT